MPTKPTTIIPLIAVAALLAGCGTGATGSDASPAAPSGATSSPASSRAAAADDCSALQEQFVAGDLPQEFYDGVDQGVQVVETTSGTVLQDSPLGSGGSAPASASAYPDQVKPKAAWPRDAVVFIDPTSGKVVKTIDVPEGLECAPY